MEYTSFTVFLNIIKKFLKVVVHFQWYLMFLMLLHLLVPVKSRYYCHKTSLQSYRPGLLTTKKKKNHNPTLSHPLKPRVQCSLLVLHIHCSCDTAADHWPQRTCACNWRLRSHEQWVQCHWWRTREQWWLQLSVKGLFVFLTLKLPLWFSLPPTVYTYTGLHALTFSFYENGGSSKSQFP